MGYHGLPGGYPGGYLPAYPGATGAAEMTTFDDF